MARLALIGGLAFAAVFPVSAATPAADDTTPRATTAAPLVSRTARASAARVTLARHPATAAGDVMVVAITAR